MKIRISGDAKTIFIINIAQTQQSEIEQVFNSKY